MATANAQELKHLAAGNPSAFRLALGKRLCTNGVDGIASRGEFSSPELDVKMSTVFSNAIANTNAELRNHTGADQLTDAETHTLVKHVLAYAGNKAKKDGLTVIIPEPVFDSTLVGARVSSADKATEKAVKPDASLASLAAECMPEVLQLNGYVDFFGRQAKKSMAVNAKVAVLEAQVKAITDQIASLKASTGNLSEASRLAEFIAGRAALVLLMTDEDDIAFNTAKLNAAIDKYRALVPQPEEKKEEMGAPSDGGTAEGASTEGASTEGSTQPALNMAA